MKAEEPMPNTTRGEIEQLRVLAKAGNPEAQIEIAGKLFAAVNRGKIAVRDGNPDAFRWVRTAEINPALTDEQRVHLAEILLKDDNGDWVHPSRATFLKAKRLLDHAYWHGPNDIRGKAARLLGEFYERPFSFRGYPFRDIPRSFVWFRRAARVGNAKAALKLGINYYDGLGVLENRKLAHKWLKKCKELCRANPDPVVEIMCQQVEGERKFVVPKEKFRESQETLIQAEYEYAVSKAVTGLRNLANMGYAPAMVLWSSEIYDTCQKKFYNEAKTYLRDAVRQGYPDALALAGRWLLTGGRGVRQDINLARKLLDRAATLGNATALAYLAHCALNGWKTPPHQVEIANELWQRARKQMGKNDGRCHYELFILKKPTNQISSLPLLRKAAEAGDVRACTILGERYRRGRGVPIDKNEAERWLEKAAYRQHPRAQYEYSQECANEMEELLWLSKAMNAGVAKAGVKCALRFLGCSPGILRNRWEAERDAERLFRRFGPLCPELGYGDVVIKHFLSKPLSKRSSRDIRFLDGARAFLREKNPARAARLFMTEDPTFAAECQALASENENLEVTDEKRLQDMEIQLAEAESEFQSANDEMRIRAKRTFRHWAGYFLQPSGRKIFESIRERKRMEIREMFFRCFWRGVQTYWPYYALSEDTQKRINTWIEMALVLYCEKGEKHHRPEPADTYPAILREAIRYCCENIKVITRAGLSQENIVLVHEFAGNLLDEKALAWLVQNNVDVKRWESIASDAKIPWAMRMRADRISARLADAQEERGVEEPLIALWSRHSDQEEVSRLLREAAEKGDPIAQYRQGETLVQRKKPGQWREEAMSWFQKAASESEGTATLPSPADRTRVRLHAAMRLGQLLLPKSPDEAMTCFKKAAQASNADLRTSAEYEMGKLFLMRGDLVSAASHLKNAAGNNIPDALELLVLEPQLQSLLSEDEIRAWGLALLNREHIAAPIGKDIRGRVLTRLGRLEKEKTQSAEWFRQAAEAGDGPGTYEWARCLLYGDGCDRNFPEAEKWLHIAWKRCNGTDRNSNLAAYISTWNSFLMALKPQTEEQSKEVSITAEQVEKVWKDVQAGEKGTNNG